MNVYGGLSGVIRGRRGEGGKERILKDEEMQVCYKYYKRRQHNETCQTLFKWEYNGEGELFKVPCTHRIITMKSPHIVNVR
jgi:hypothetical protein